MKSSRTFWALRICLVLKPFDNRKQNIMGTDFASSLTSSFYSGSPCLRSFPLSSVCKESACSTGDLGLIPGSGRSPGGGHGNPLQYSCLENPMDRGAWWATVHGVAKSWTTEGHSQWQQMANQGILTLSKDCWRNERGCGFLGNKIQWPLKIFFHT